jgi:hypothetical protein
MIWHRYVKAASRLIKMEHGTAERDVPIPLSGLCKYISQDMWVRIRELLSMRWFLSKYLLLSGTYNASLSNPFAKQEQLLEQHPASSYYIGKQMQIYTS